MCKNPCQGGVFMNPTSEQKRIAFGYNRHENRIVINEGQAACVKLIFDY